MSSEEETVLRLELVEIEVEDGEVGDITEVGIVVEMIDNVLLVVASEYQNEVYVAMSDAVAGVYFFYTADIGVDCESEQSTVRWNYLDLEHCHASVWRVGHTIEDHGRRYSMENIIPFHQGDPKERLNFSDGEIGYFFSGKCFAESCLDDRFCCCCRRLGFLRGGGRLLSAVCRS